MHSTVPEVPTVSPDQFATFDKEFVAVQTASFEEILSELGADEAQTSWSSKPSETVDVSDDEQEETDPVTQAEAPACIRKLRTFCAMKVPAAFTQLCAVESVIERELVRAPTTQTSLERYFPSNDH